MTNKPPRSQATREIAERILVHVVHYYGKRPEFVVLGGLVPELLCTRSSFLHAGTTDVDIQVNFEIACNLANVVRLEQALRDAGLLPAGDKLWRWTTNVAATETEVRFELLADIPDRPTRRQIEFLQCDSLGAMNLHGTGFASRNVEVQKLRAQLGGEICEVEVNFSGLAGFLLAKLVAARERYSPKDWYDIAFVLLNNDVGGPIDAAERILDQFTESDIAMVHSALNELRCNFEDSKAQGAQAYVQQMLLNYPDLRPEVLATSAILAVQEFRQRLLDGTS